MCGNRRRAARCGGAYGNQYNRSHGGHPLVMGLIAGVQQMRLAHRQQQTLAAAPAPTPASIPAAREFEPQTRGVVYPLINDDEKKQIPEQENINYEVLPTYEEAANIEKPVVDATAARSIEAPYVPTSIELPKSVDSSLASRSLNAFNTALADYRQSECGGRCRAKRAARILVNELVDQEVARLQAAQGSLACGQRKQVRRDMKPVKAMLKDAVREAGRERVY